jgi:hypothetical protein
MAMNYIIYVGSASGSSTQAEFSGAFVDEGNGRLYIYNGSGNLNISNIPAGSGVTSYLYGSFSYFTTSSTKYAGVPTPSPSPSPSPSPAPSPGPSPAPSPGPGPSPAPASACDAAPVIDNIVAAAGNLSIYFTLASGTAPIAVTLEYSTDNVTWNQSTGGYTSPRVITQPTQTTYYRLYAICSGPVNSPTSLSEVYVVSAPPATTKTGNVIVRGTGESVRVILSQPAVCNYSIILSGTWFDYDTSSSGTWETPPFQIASGNTSSGYQACIDQNTYQPLFQLAGGTPNYSTNVSGGLTSSQCAGSVTLTLSN